MSANSARIRSAIQKLTEAIWNLDQLDFMTSQVKDEYVRIQFAREKLMKLVKDSKSEP